MNEFSIQDPIIRNYITEWLFHKFLKYEGLIAINYQFINFTQNGERKKTYVIEQHMDKYLLENNLRRDGPIFYFDFNNEDAVDSTNWRKFNIKIYQKNFWNKKIKS